jgi:hypothetical protein
MNLMTEYRKALDARVESGTLSETTKGTYMTDAAKVLEALVGMIPVAVVQAYIEEWGAKGDYRTVIRDLAAIARERQQHFEAMRED